MTYYKATPEQWKVQEKFAPESEDATCLLELRSRIERLELGAGIHDIVTKEIKNSFPTKTSRLLIERVAIAIHPDPNLYLCEARIVIQEVADWLREYGGWNQVTVADLLKKELDE